MPSRKGLRIVGQEQLNMSQLFLLVAKKANGILACIRNNVANRTRAGIVKPHLKSCVQDEPGLSITRSHEKFIRRVAVVRSNDDMFTTLEVHGIYLQPMLETPHWSMWMAEGGCDPMGYPLWRRFASRTCDSMGNPS
ncbi:hypothetical protein TURU_099130 [Turdus rufiventris]|nr:hypothetical protein TURU_099130 [Turdus rufiventris]